MLDGHHGGQPHWKHVALRLVLVMFVNNSTIHIMRLLMVLWVTGPPGLVVAEVTTSEQG